jgi:hypothetical protein
MRSGHPNPYSPRRPGCQNSTQAWRVLNASRHTQGCADVKRVKLAHIRNHSNGYP